MASVSCSVAGVDEQRLLVTIVFRTPGCGENDGLGLTFRAFLPRTGVVVAVVEVADIVRGRPPPRLNHESLFVLEFISITCFDRSTFAFNRPET